MARMMTNEICHLRNESRFLTASHGPDKRRRSLLAKGESSTRRSLGSRWDPSRPGPLGHRPMLPI